MTVSRTSVRLQDSMNSIEVASNGDAYLFASRLGVYVRYRPQTGKPELVACPASLGRLVGEARLAVWAGEQQGLLVERETGKVVKTLTKRPAATCREIAVSDDGALVAMSFGSLNSAPALEVFETSSGKRVHQLALDACALGLIFSEDGGTLLYFLSGALHRLPVGGKKAVASRFSTAHFTEGPALPRVRRRDGMLFIHWALPGHASEAVLIDEKKSKVALVVEEAECASLGPLPESIVTANGKDLRVLDFGGKELAKLPRPLSSRLEGAAPHQSQWYAVGTHLELFDLASLSSKAPKSKRR